VAREIRGIIWGRWIWGWDAWYDMPLQQGFNLRALGSFWSFVREVASYSVGLCLEVKQSLG
jgi:hypothetical protein